MRDLTSSEATLFRFFQANAGIEFSHSELEYGDSAKSWYLDEGVEFPRNIGRTARGLVQKGLLVRRARGSYAYDPSIDPDQQALGQSRANLESELRSLIRMCDRIVTAAADPMVTTETERMAIRDATQKVLGLMRINFPKMFD